MSANAPREPREPREERHGLCCVGAYWASYIKAGWCAVRTIFAHQKLGNAGFPGVFGVRFFYFSAEGVARPCAPVGWNSLGERGILWV
jgi:hypothetical protein